MEADSTQALPKGKVANTPTDAIKDDPKSEHDYAAQGTAAREGGSDIYLPSGEPISSTDVQVGENGVVDGMESVSDGAITLTSEEDIIRELNGEPTIPGAAVTRIIDTVPEQIRQASPARALPSINIDERLGRLLLSIVLAALLWVYVVNLENPTLTVPFRELVVDVRGAAPAMKVNANPTNVDVVVQGPQNVLDTINRSTIHPYIDVTGLNEGVHQVPVLADINSNRARDLNYKFTPNLIQVQLELQVTRVYSVEVVTSGTPAIGYGLENPQVTPDSVGATGSRDAIARIARLVVQVDVEGKASTQQGERPVKALDAAGQEISGLTFSPATAQVVVPVKLLFNYKVVPVRVPLVGQPAPGYQVTAIEYNPTSVTVCCSPSVLEPLQFLDTTAVPITATTSTVITTTTLILPQGVDLYPGQPSEISVTVKVATFETTLPVTVAPTVDGLEPGLSSVVSPNRVEVTLAGTFSQLQTLAPSDVQAIIDVHGRGAGTYSMTPRIVVPQGIKVQTTTPPTVTITLIAPTPVPTQTPVPVPTATHTPEPLPSATTQATRPPTVPATPTTTHTPTVAAPEPTDTAVVQITPTTAQPAQPTATSTATSTPTP